MKKRTLRTQSTSLPKPVKMDRAKSSAPPQYPFSAVVGQEEMKLALMLNAVDPSIGGVLIMGHRGTGKSTAVRGLAALLPEIKVVVGCTYRCDPGGSNLCADCQKKLDNGERLVPESAAVAVVDLPLGATEDRVCGTIDIERALQQGSKTFEPGLLARANRGLLYIDEVNLLDDHLVDVLLDVAVTGVNKVEREGISIEHPARFVLIGSGNPEEGELRPQLLDRFGLHVQVTTDDDLDRRVDIVERCNAFEHDPEKFCARLARDQEQLRNKINRAQKNYDSVIVERPLLRQIAQLCSVLKIDGHRGELTIARAGRALAAFEGRKKVTADDVRRVSPMALRHRLRRDPLEEAGTTERIQRALQTVFSEQPKKRDAGSNSGGQGDDAGFSGQNTESEARNQSAAQDSRSRSKSAGPDRSSDLNGNRGVDSPAVPSLSSAVGIELAEFGFSERSEVARQQSKTADHGSRGDAGPKQISYGSQRGRYARAINVRRDGSKIAVDATLRASAGARYRMPGARYRVSGAGKKQSLAPGTRHLTPLQAPETRHLTPTLRYKQLSRKSGRLFIFAIDASGSMAVNRIREAKGAALGLLKQSYIKRDRVAIVGFRGTSAELLLPPSRSMIRARRVLDSLGVGGGTPLTAGLVRSLEVVKRERSNGEIILLIFTDGNANVAAGLNGRASEPALRAERREIIERELAHSGSALAKAGAKVFVVDTQTQWGSNDDARVLAEKLGAKYLTVKRSI
ncbi:MAG: magnesium chelatase ATPase subunit I [Pyrinomonadaceae bacterium]|nr:magnesium chelatase ATPase subunit I [Pyrinomonadaceae bacterium]